MIAQQIARLDGQGGAAGGSVGDDEASTQAVVSESLASIEQNIERVNALLQDDPATAQMLSQSAHAWVPALAPDMGGQDT